MSSNPAQAVPPPFAPPHQWQNIDRPIVCLAPMDGITDSAYRQIIRQIHSKVVLFSEFTSADGFLRSAHVRKRLAFSPEEHPYFVQLFGSNPTSFLKAALTLEQAGVAGVDINMGCPAKKIVHSQHGSSLMRDVEGACRIVETIANACRVQVSVKTRLGWHDHQQLIPFIRALTNAGASLITIHGRTYRQGFSGQANWQPIYALKQALPQIPILGNGDLQSMDDGLAMLRNLDGFMIGRAAIGNPWVFATAKERSSLTMFQRMAVVKEHFARMLAHKGNAHEHRAVLEFRKHLAGYLRGFALAKMARVALLRVACAKDLDAQLTILQTEGPQALAKAS